MTIQNEIKRRSFPLAGIRVSAVSLPAFHDTTAQTRADTWQCPNTWQECGKINTLVDVTTIAQEAGFRYSVAVTEGLMAAIETIPSTLLTRGRAGAFMGRNLDGFPFRS